MSKRIKEDGGEAFCWRATSGIIFVSCIAAYFALPHVSIAVLIFGIAVPLYTLAEASGAVDEHKDRREKGYITRALKDAAQPLDILEIAALTHHKVQVVRTDLSLLEQSGRVKPVASAGKRQSYAIAA